MKEEGPIVNRVAQSSLVTINLEDYYHKGERVVYDIKDNLYEGIILKEKDFRAFIKSYDWSQYKDKNVALTCSVDAIIPTWAYMLLAVQITPYAHLVVMGGLDALEQALFQQALSKMEPKDYEGEKVIIKGCSQFPVPPFAFIELTRLLRPHAASIMYGEPCSTVPLYKKQKK